MQRAISAKAGTTLRTGHRFSLPEVAVDRASLEPLHRQVCNALRSAILARRLPAGSRLPSTRSLAAHLRVSRNTVLNAYEALVLEGFLIGKTGSGTRVREFSLDTHAVPATKLPDLPTLLRQANYPSKPLGFEDPDGNPVYAHR